MTTLDISQRIDNLADQIDQYDLGAASRLRQLSRAFGYGELAEEWAATDIYRLIDPSEIMEQVHGFRSGNRWVGIIELVRNVMLLVPIAVTWFGITRAVDGYYALVSADPTQAQLPFIYLWQSGFGAQITPTLGQLGLINALLLGIVIVLTAIVLIWSTWTDSIQERNAELLRRNLSETLAIASLHLQTVSRRTPTSLIEHFRDLAGQMIAQLETERMRIVELAEQREREVTTLSQFSSELRLGANELLETTRLSGSVAHELSERVAALAAPVTQLAAAVEKLIAVGAQVAAPLNQTLAVQVQLNDQILATTRAVQQTAQTLQTAADGTRGASEGLMRSQAAFVSDLQSQRLAQTTLADSVGQSAQSLSAVGQNLEQITRGLNTNLGSLAPSTVALADQGQAMLVVIRSLEETSRTLTTQQETIATQLQALITDSEDTTRKTVEVLGRSVAMFEQASARQDGFLNAIVHERKAQTELAELMSAGTTEFETLADSIRQTAVSLHAIAVDLSELRDSLPRVQDDRRNR